MVLPFTKFFISEIVIDGDSHMLWEDLNEPPDGREKDAKEAFRNILFLTDVRARK